MSKVKRYCQICGSVVNITVYLGIWSDSSCENEDCPEHGTLEDLQDYDIEDNYRYSVEEPQDDDC